MAGRSIPFAYIPIIRLPIQVRHDAPTTPHPQRPVLDTDGVWAITVSLAATQVIVFTFFSSRYLDVSVPPVPATCLCVQHIAIRRSPDQCLLTAPRSLSQLSHVLHRLLSPRHPPCTLSNLIATRVSSRRTCCTATLRFDSQLLLGVLQVPPRTEIRSGYL